MSAFPHRGRVSAVNLPSREAFDISKKGEVILRNSEIQRTLEYYDAHAEEYAAATAELDLSHLYDHFESLLPPGGAVLDAGCGSGRDVRHFLDQGFRVTAFDGSKRLAALASATTGVPVVHCRFDQFRSQEQFDGVWACASLLHLPREALVKALLNMRRALKPDGVLFGSVRLAPDQNRQDDDRFFLDLPMSTYLDELQNLGFEVRKYWISADVRSPSAKWLNFLAKK